MRKTIAYFHLPGLFEAYAFYRVFLPLFFEHREYFYDWCAIGSLYGAPADCIWGGGRVGSGEWSAQEVLALTRAYGLSARLTFSNSLLRPEHLSDGRCNALCRAFARSDGPQNGVIVHSDLLLDYLKANYPQLSFISSTTKVLTNFRQLRQELERADFSAVVPDFRLNRAFDSLRALPQPLKDKTEFLCNECCSFGCRERRACYEAVSRKNRRSISARPPARPRATVFPAPWRTLAFSASARSGTSTCPWAFPISSSRAAASAAPCCWNFCSTT